MDGPNRSISPRRVAGIWSDISDQPGMSHFELRVKEISETNIARAVAWGLRDTMT